MHKDRYMNTDVTPQNIDEKPFAEWLDQNDSFQIPYSDTTKRVYRSVVSGLLNFLRKEDIHSFGEFNVAWARSFLARNPETGDVYSQSYQTLRASALNVFWYWLIEIGAAADNPIAMLIEKNRLDSNKKPSGGNRPKPLPYVLGWDDQRKLRMAVQNSESRASVRDYALITLALASGIRCDEICTLLLPNVDLTYSRLRVTGKGNKERIVNFSHDSQAAGHAVAALEIWMQERERLLNERGKNLTNELFVTQNGKPMTGSLVYQTVAKYLKLAGLETKARHKGAHLLRHTATSIMFARQVPVLQIQENLGHGNLVTTQIYAHLLPSETLYQAAAA